MSDDEVCVSWADFVLERAKEMFGTSNLNNEDVFKYFIMCLKKNNKQVYIVDDGEFNDVPCVVYSFYSPDTPRYEKDLETEDDSLYVIFEGNNKEECLKFCKQHNLNLIENKDY